MKTSITINDQIITNVDTDVSILESLEKNDVEVEFQCRDGYCGACRCKLIRGEVKYIKDTIAFINEDEVLTCSATPLSDIQLSS